MKISFGKIGLAGLAALVMAAAATGYAKNMNCEKQGSFVEENYDYGYGEETTISLLSGQPGDCHPDPDYDPKGECICPIVKNGYQNDSFDPFPIPFPDPFPNPIIDPPCPYCIKDCNSKEIKDIAVWPPDPGHLDLPSIGGDLLVDKGPIIMAYYDPTIDSPEIPWEDCKYHPECSARNVRL